MQKLLSGHGPSLLIWRGPGRCKAGGYLRKEEKKSMPLRVIMAASVPRSSPRLDSIVCKSSRSSAEDNSQGLAPSQAHDDQLVSMMINTSLLLSG